MTDDQAASTEATPPLDRPCKHPFPHDGPCEPTEATERPDLRAALVELMDAMGEYERAWMTSRTGYTRVGEAKQAVYAALTGALPSEPLPVWTDEQVAEGWIDPPPAAPEEEREP